MKKMALFVMFIIFSCNISLKNLQVLFLIPLIVYLMKMLQISEEAYFLNIFSLINRWKA